VHDDRHFHAGPERLRSPERIARLEIARVVALVLEGIAARSVLDVGTGTGLFAEAFAARGLAATGVDDSPEMLEHARRLVPSAAFRQGRAEQLDLPDGSFDLVFLGLVLHESHEPLRALREARRVARARVGILEWPYREEADGPPLAHRLEPRELARLIGEAGFAKVEETALTVLTLHRLTP
jgi:ubiquinone/menaquinone biosynthesis C-methylase UbiE